MHDSCLFSYMWLRLNLFLSICRRNQQHGTHIDDVWGDRSRERQMCKHGKLIKLVKKIKKISIKCKEVLSALWPTHGILYKYIPWRFTWLVEPWWLDECVLVVKEFFLNLKKLPPNTKESSPFGIIMAWKSNVGGWIVCIGRRSPQSQTCGRRNLIMKEIKTKKEIKKQEENPS